MDGHTLDYAAVAPAYLDLFARVRRRDRLLHAKLVGQLALGALATLVAPLTLATVLAMAISRARPVNYPSLIALAVVVSAVVLPAFRWGPRRLIDAWAKMRDRARLGQVNPKLATDVLWWLRDHGAAVHVNQVPDLPRPQRATLLSFLVLHDWIDQSHDGRRIWLRSTTQHVLHRAAA
jgi:hypothetical protein